MNKLIIEHNIIEHPYPDEKNRTVYGMIKTILVDSNDKKIMVLTQKVWDLLQYYGWFIKNSNNLLGDDVPVFFPIGDSIAIRINKFLGQVDDDKLWDEIELNGYYEKYYDYAISHNYFVSLNGSGESDIIFPGPIYMGLFENKYTISMYAEEDKKRKINTEHWSYEFDLPELIQFAKNEYNKIINNTKGHN